MWISKGAAAEIAAARKRADIMEVACIKRDIENAALLGENGRMRADMDWFKLRLNQVERERAMLVQDRLGVKITVPEFVPTYEDPASALAQMPDFGSVGSDARPDAVATDAEPGEGVDYSLMPGYKGSR